MDCMLEHIHEEADATRSPPLDAPRLIEGSDLINSHTTFSFFASLKCIHGRLF